MGVAQAVLDRHIWVHHVHKTLDKTTRTKLTKIAGDACGVLASWCIGVATLVITLSVLVAYYEIEMWPVVSVMVGIALTCILVRLSLFLSNFKEFKPDEVIKEVFEWLVVFTVLGVVLGGVMSDLFDKPYPDEMCYEMIMGTSDGHNDEAMEDCIAYRDNIHLVLNFIPIGYAMAMIFWFVFNLQYRISRIGRNK